MVELLPSKQAAASSNLVPRSSFTFRWALGYVFWRQEASLVFFPPPYLVQPNRLLEPFGQYIADVAEEEALPLG